jgi:hypothetical protein
MSRRQLTSTLVVGVLVVVGVVAAVDAARSRDSVGRSAGGRTETGPPDSATSLAGTLKAEGIRGVLYYSDLEADCRVQALHLPALETTSPPMLRACRFELPPDPGTGALDRGTAWQPGGQAVATCAEGWVEVSTRAGEAIGKTKGCAPAWKPDRTLTVIRDGEVWGTPCRGPEGYARPACWRELLSTAELKRAAHAVPFVPRDPATFEASWRSGSPGSMRLALPSSCACGFADVFEFSGRWRSSRSTRARDSYEPLSTLGPSICA